MSKLDSALAWAERGFRVFPLLPNRKQPAVQGWTESATSDPEAVRALWSMSDYNIGVLTDGLLVVDLDVKATHTDAVANFEAIGGGTPTLTVRTPTGGWHLYYRTPHEVASSQGDLAPAVDVRGFHGYVLAPGSTVDGTAYEVAQDAPVAEAPENLLSRCRRPGEARTADPTIPATELDAHAALTAVADFLARTAPAIQGQGGEARTLQVAMEARDRGVSEPMCLDLMLEHFNERCDPPWEADELAVKVANAYAYAQNPAGIKTAAVDFEGFVAVPGPAVSVESPVSEGVEPFQPFKFGTILPSAKLIPRAWVIERMLEVGEITALVAPGGAGKSQFTLTIAFLLAIGAENMFGFRNIYAGCPRRSIIYNAEDSIQEMSKRLAALCSEYGVDENQVLSMISITSGRNNQFNLQVTTGGQVAEVTAANEVHLGLLISAAQAEDIVMIGLDPLSKIHTAKTNENEQMTVVMRAIEYITEKSAVATMLSVHMSKAGSSLQPGDANSAGGAASIINSVRQAFNLSNPQPSDVSQYGLTIEEKARVLRLDDAKMNRGLLTGQPTWIAKHSVRLHTGDYVGVFKKANMGENYEVLRNRIAEGLAAEMTREGKGSVTLPEASLLLSRVDPIYGTLEVNGVRLRLERVLSPPVELSSGYSLAYTVSGNTKLITLS